MSRRRLGAAYHVEPYEIETPDEAALNACAAGVAAGDPAALGYLHRVPTLCGLGISFIGVSNHGSMGEHQISHYPDCFAGDRHPGTLHKQVGVASLAMARIQLAMLAGETPPLLRLARVDAADTACRTGADIAAQRGAEYRRKALDDAGAARLNERLRALWPDLRRECLAMAISLADTMRLLRATGGATTAAALGAPVAFWRKAVRHAYEMRNSFSFADLACDAGMLDGFAEAET